MPAQLPPGFTLDPMQGAAPKGQATLPKGFVVDKPAATVDEGQDLARQFETGEFSPEVSAKIAEAERAERASMPMGAAAMGGIAVTPEGEPPIDEGAMTTLQNIGRVYPALETAANLITSSYGVPASGIAGLLSLPFGPEAAGKTIEEVQKALVYTPQTAGGEQLTEAAAYPFEKVTEAAGAISDPIAEAGYPKAAATLKTAIESAPAVAGGRRAMVSGLKPLNARVKQAVKTGVDKAIRPSVVGKRTAKQRRDYYNKAQTAVEEIVKNKENLDIRNDAGIRTEKLPQTLDEFSQAIEQTKRNIFDEYDALAKEGDVSVNLTKTANDLEPAVSNRVLEDFSPETVEYANKRMESLRNRGDYTAAETQEAIKLLNQSLEKYYRDPSPSTKGQAFVDSFIANDLRKQLDTAIEKQTGPGYSDLKKKYGALKSIEQEVNHRAIVDARRNNKGLVDFSDIMTSGDIVSGMMRREPATMAAGAAGKTLASYYKMLNDPNRIVKTMFSDVEKATKATPRGRGAAALAAGTAMQEADRGE